MTELIIARSPKEIGDVLLDNVLLLTILFIFTSALITIFLKSRARDKCLKDFDRYPVTFEDRKKKFVWGTLRTFSTGFELEYKDEYRDPDGHVESSFVVYEGEFQNVHALYRFHDLLSDEHQERRRRQVARTHRPSIMRRFARKVRNFFATLRDAFVSSIDAWIGQSKKGSRILSTQSAKVSEMSKGVIGHFGNSYDPILERFIGKRVVVEIEEGGQLGEFPGILKEYTAKFLEVLKVEAPRRFSLPVRVGKQSMIPGIEWEMNGNEMKIKNGRAAMLRNVEVKGEEWSRALEDVPPGEEREITLEEGGAAGLTLHFEMLQDFDVIVPRSYATVRHAGKRDPIDWRSYLWGGEASSRV